MGPDSACITDFESILEGARKEYGENLVSAPGLPFHPALTYAETHFALAAVLLALLDSHGARWLDVAESRLRLWNRHDGPATFFNAMAVCLTAIVLRRARNRHSGLESILSAILARTNAHRQIAYSQWSGNNCYLQQVAVDLVLLPLARGELPSATAAPTVAEEFRRYRTPEGFFFDLPREGTRQERLSPPTYVMKMLFLLGICHEFHPADEFADLFLNGMQATLPLLTRDGSFGYFGRTDNSPFGAGLTIFNLRKAAQMCARLRTELWSAAMRADEYYRSFPRTTAGLLECNRFADAASQAERSYSRDAYAKVGEYSVSSCAYALLGHHCVTMPPDAAARRFSPRGVAQSRDLGLVKLALSRSEIVLRTRSEVTSWDRRYLGPTVLRFTVGDELLIGAISKTVSSELPVADAEPSTRLRAVLRSLLDWYSRGLDQLDATAVGFVPVVRRGPVDYLPYETSSIAVEPEYLEIKYRLLALHVRGWRACALEIRERIRGRLPWGKFGERGPPPMRLTSSYELVRKVHVQEDACRIHDRITGPLQGTQILCSTRALPRAAIRVSGLEKTQTLTGWGSDGRQEIVVYSARPSEAEFEYECVIGATTQTR